MIPVPLWAILGAALAWVGSGAGLYWFGRTDGVALEAGARAREERVQQLAIDAATLAAADAISGLKVRYVPIREKAEAAIREVPQYRDCVHDDRVFDAINEALSGAGPGRVPSARTSH